MFFFLVRYGIPEFWWMLLLLWWAVLQLLNYFIFLIEFIKISEALLLFVVSAAKPSTLLWRLRPDCHWIPSECASLIEPLPRDAVKTKYLFFSLSSFFTELSSITLDHGRIRRTHTTDHDGFSLFFLCFHAQLTKFSPIFPPIFPCKAGFQR